METKVRNLKLVVYSWLTHVTKGIRGAL